MSATSTAWKAAIHQACADAVQEPLPPGSIALRMELSVSRRRNWATLWKPAIDALGPALGIPDPRHPFRPDDDRITDLELHRRLDDALGNDVVVKAWWRLTTD